jgi:hypothetical protein
MTSKHVYAGGSISLHVYRKRTQHGRGPDHPARLRSLWNGSAFHRIQLLRPCDDTGCFIHRSGYCSVYRGGWSRGDLFPWHVYREGSRCVNTMTNRRVLIARTISALALILGGGVSQIALWKRGSMGYMSALEHHPYLWLMYFLLALLVGEHALKWMKKQ